jgi:hypothetical protein
MHLVLPSRLWAPNFGVSQRNVLSGFATCVAIQTKDVHSARYWLVLPTNESFSKTLQALDAPKFQWESMRKLGKDMVKTWEGYGCGWRRKYACLLQMQRKSKEIMLWFIFKSHSHLVSKQQQYVRYRSVFALTHLAERSFPEGASR